MADKIESPKSAPRSVPESAPESASQPAEAASPTSHSPQHDPPIEAERPLSPPPNNDSEVPEDDGYASTVGSAESTSLSSSVRDYQFENSRRYHKFKEGLYQFPNDLPEQEREDMKHTVAVHLLGGKLHRSPLESPQKIIDVGTGTGSWAIDSRSLTNSENDTC
jgi:hypothetical protein